MQLALLIIMHTVIVLYKITNIHVHIATKLKSAKGSVLIVKTTTDLAQHQL